MSKLSLFINLLSSFNSFNPLIKLSFKFDLISFKEIQCTFKKRYERMAGPLILLSDDYFLVPLCISPIRDSWNNGLFGNNWTVCYTVFDIKKNRAVFNGIVSETNKMHIVDAMLIN